MLLKLFQKTNVVIYNILGSKLSTKLACSPLGKLLLSILFKEKKDIGIYTTNEGLKFEMDSAEAVNSGVVILGSWNQFETNVLKAILQPGDVVIDVGAFMGSYSLLVSKLIGGEGKVYAFEPSPDHLRKLKRNILLNNFRNIQTFNLALSNKKGVVKFYVAGSRSSLMKNEAESHMDKKVKPIKVKAVTLNDFVNKERIKHIDFIKIDVEGWDLQVLKGASNILKGKDAPDIMVEVIDDQLKRAGSSSYDLIKYMKSFAYTPYIFTRNGLRPYEELSMRTFNLLFRKKSTSIACRINLT